MMKSIFDLLVDSVGVHKPLYDMYMQHIDVLCVENNNVDELYNASRKIIRKLHKIDEEPLFSQITEFNYLQNLTIMLEDFIEMYEKLHAMMVREGIDTIDVDRFCRNPQGNDTYFKKFVRKGLRPQDVLNLADQIIKYVSERALCKTDPKLK